jgi:type IV pilus assembly protein PilB
MNIEGISQVQVNSDIGLTFANVLRSILRQDPDIIMIGEIRDDETAKIAVRASITGHLVLSTIHTNNSLNTIERLLDMDVERYLLASALEGIISQKLARKLCDKCKKKRATNEYEKEIFRKTFGMEVNEVYSAVGCEECGNGYRGRIAIHEVLLITQEIRDAISNSMPKDELRTLVYNTDVNTLLQDGLEKVINGYTTFEEVLKLIELDDDVEDKEAISAYKYNLNAALKQSEIAKTSKINTAEIKKAAEPVKPITNDVLFKDDSKKDETLIDDPLDKTQVLEI